MAFGNCAQPPSRMLHSHLRSAGAGRAPYRIWQVALVEGHELVGMVHQGGVGGAFSEPGRDDACLLAQLREAGVPDAPEAAHVPELRFTRQRSFAEGGKGSSCLEWVHLRMVCAPLTVCALDCASCICKQAKGVRNILR